METKCTNFAQNNSECCCTNIKCVRHGTCCDCIRFHRALGSAVACMRAESLEASKKPAQAN